MVPKRTQLSIALTAAFLSSTMSMGSMAQTATPKADIEKAETVVVTGYRAAIEKALEIKLASNAIMESANCLSRTSPRRSRVCPASPSRAAKVRASSSACEAWALISTARC